jgi:chaperonin cofactor prefoldin
LAQSHPKHLQRLQDSVASLEERICRMELSSESVQRVNEQTLETFQHLQNQLINKLNSHDGSFLQRFGNLAEIEKKWVKESE